MKFSRTALLGAVPVVLAAFGFLLLQPNKEIVSQSTYANINTPPMKAVFVQDNYAYLGYGNRLIVVDVSDPKAPAFVGQSPELQNQVETIFVFENYVYVIDSKKIVHLIDVEDKSSPLIDGRMYEQTNETIIRDVKADGTYVYVIEDDLARRAQSGLRILLLSDFSSVEFVKTTFRANTVQLTESYIYFTDPGGYVNPRLPLEQGRLHVLDRTNFSKIAVVDRFYNIFEVKKNVGYLLHGIDFPDEGILGSLHVDLMDMNDYSILDTIEYESKIVNYHLAVDDESIYVAVEGTIAEPDLTIYPSGLTIIDSTNPSNLVHVSFCETIIPNDIAIKDGYVFLATNEGLLIFNAIEPDKPFIQSSYLPKTEARVESERNINFGLNFDAFFPLVTQTCD